MMASYNIFLQRDTDYAETLTFYSDECMSSAIDLTGYILSLTDTETLAMASGDYYWDLRVVTAASVVARWVGGTVKVSGTITRL